MSKQTAVEWIQQQVKQQGITHYFSLTEILEQAKEIEKQMTIDAYLAGYSATENHGDSVQYYNETYKKEDK